MGFCCSYFLESFQPVQLKDAGTAVPHSHYARLMNKVRAAPSPSHPDRICTEDGARPGHICTWNAAPRPHLHSRNRASCARCMLHADDVRTSMGPVCLGVGGFDRVPCVAAAHGGLVWRIS